MKKKIQGIDRNAVFFTAMILLVIIRFFSLADSFLTTSTKQFDATAPSDEIVSGQELVQTFTCKKNGLDSISLLFGTHLRTNESNLRVELTSEGQIIQTWEVSCALFLDNDYHTFELDQSIPKSKNKTYELKITSDANKGQGVSIYESSEAKTKGLSIDGQDENVTLCYTLGYRASFASIFERPVNTLHILLVLGCIAVLIVLIRTTEKLKIERAFLVLWIVLCATFLVSAPLFDVPDEVAHFCRAYEISCGHMITPTNGVSAGEELPLDQDLNLLMEDWGSFYENKGMALTENDVYTSFYNTASYSPVTYIPQAIGIFLSRHVTDKILIIAYAGRIMNLLAITLLLYFAIKWIPFGKAVLAFICLIPVNIQESVSLAPDGMVLALTIFMIAYVLKLRYAQKEVMRGRQIVLLYAMAAAVSLIKIVYLPFVLVYFMIPYERFGGKGKKAGHAIAIAVLSLVCSLGWLSLAGNYLLTPGTDSMVQTAYILAHPLRYLAMMATTYFKSGSEMVLSMFGSSLAALNVNGSGLVMMLYGILMVLVFSRVPKKREFHETSERAIFFLVILAIVFLTSTSLYIQWTPVYDQDILGIQGRYFLPLMMPLYLMIHPSPEEKHREYLGIGGKCVVVGVDACASLALLFSSLAAPK